MAGTRPAMTVGMTVERAPGTPRFVRHSPAASFQSVIVMAGLVPANHDFRATTYVVVDSRHKAGQDSRGSGP